MKNYDFLNLQHKSVDVRTLPIHLQSAGKPSNHAAANFRFVGSVWLEALGLALEAELEKSHLQEPFFWAA